MTPLSSEEVRKMRAACRLAARLLSHVGRFVRAGVTTNELDRIAHDFTLSEGAAPAPLGYHGFPKSICTSVNEVICHGVPDDRPLVEGDVLNIDVTCIKDGFFGDTSAMFVLGSPGAEAIELVEAAREAMLRGIEQVAPQATTGDIGFAINKFVTKKGYFAVREIGGHGIGRRFHEDPFVPSFGKKGRGDVLRPWTCITVEPMINLTPAPVIEHDIPGSTIKWYTTGDKTLSAQFEHTVLVTDTGHEILTLE
jgi:methionyl aminopeptidase